MGIENRDYIRESKNQGFHPSGFFAETPTCKIILIITALVYIAQISLVTRDSGRFSRPNLSTSIVEEWFDLDTDKVLHGQVWRLATTALCHSRFDVTHIIFNMLIFYWFGKVMESHYGSKEFFLFYLISALFSSTIFLAIQLLTGDRVNAIGASGAVMAVLCLYAMHFPRHQILLFFVIPLEMRFLLILYLLYDLHPILLQLGGAKMPTGIAHAAHVGGLLFGFLYYRRHWRLEPKLDWILYWPASLARRFGPRRNVRLFRENEKPRGSTATQAEPQLDIDEILRKITEEGVESLSAQEQESLAEASRRLRKDR